MQISEKIKLFEILIEFELNFPSSTLCNFLLKISKTYLKHIYHIYGGEIYYEKEQYYLGAALLTPVWFLAHSCLQFDFWCITFMVANCFLESQTPRLGDSYSKEIAPTVTPITVNWWCWLTGRSWGARRCCRWPCPTRLPPVLRRWWRQYGCIVRITVSLHISPLTLLGPAWVAPSPIISVSQFTAVPVTEPPSQTPVVLALLCMGWRCSDRQTG